MKATIFLALLGLAVAGSFDESITKHFVPADEAKAKAAEAKKPLLVFITEEWCGTSMPPAQATLLLAPPRPARASHSPPPYHHLHKSPHAPPRRRMQQPEDTA